MANTIDSTTVVRYLITTIKLLFVLGYGAFCVVLFEFHIK